MKIKVLYLISSEYGIKWTFNLLLELNLLIFLKGLDFNMLLYWLLDI